MTYSIRNSREKFIRRDNSITDVLDPDTTVAIHPDYLLNTQPFFNGGEVHVMKTCEHGVAYLGMDEVGMRFKHRGRSNEAVVVVEWVMIEKGLSHDFMEEWFRRVHEYESGDTEAE